MTNDDTQLPIFPAAAPAVFCDPDASQGLFADVLDRLAAAVDIDDSDLTQATPCEHYTVGELRRHTLGWLQFFSAALSDPSANQRRPDPETFELNEAQTASEIVHECSAEIQMAIADNAAGELVTMTSSRMAGDGVLAMALGEYIVHAWDLSTATGRNYEAPEDAIAPALEFLLGMVAPEYRGPDSGFFDEEVSVPANASALDKLLGFAGRDPHWAPPPLS